MDSDYLFSDFNACLFVQQTMNRIPAGQTRLRGTIFDLPQQGAGIATTSEASISQGDGSNRLPLSADQVCPAKEAYGFGSSAIAFLDGDQFGVERAGTTWESQG
jgi:hypothetical protein